MWGCPEEPFEPPSLNSQFLSRAIVRARSNRSGAVFLSSHCHHSDVSLTLVCVVVRGVSE